nr:uncharacterized protein LOC129259726 [Lytechinus pictus]
MDFGVRAPDCITTDPAGRQFESRLFAELSKLLEPQEFVTTPYHPAANGLVERFHRQLKSALKAQGDPQHWHEYLPIVLLGIRTTVKEDLTCSPAELVFGTTLRLPDAVRKPLQQPYNGPFKVLKKNSKFFTLDIGASETVSVNRLKVAYVEERADGDALISEKAPGNYAAAPKTSPSTAKTLPVQRTNTTPPVRITRYGRHVHWPKRYMAVG